MKRWKVKLEGGAGARRGGVLCVAQGCTLEVLTAGRAKKETPIKEKVAAIRRPSHVLGVLSP